MRYGVDVSSYQSTSMVPAGIDFVVARATYGRSRDKRAVEHVAQARARGCVVGLYHFFVPSQSVADQLAAFDGAADACGLTVGDLIPFVDVEAYPGSGGAWVQPCPEWAASLRLLVDGMRRTWGGCGVYLTCADWRRLGEPRWLLECPLWIAHWVGERQPAVPRGTLWALHQYRVGPYQRGANHVVGQERDPLAIDHDRALVLPTITAAHTRPGVAAGAVPMIDLYAEALDDVRRERDATVAEDWAPDVAPGDRGHGGGVA